MKPEEESSSTTTQIQEPEGPPGKKPELRPEAIARGRALLADPNYLDMALARSIAGIIMPVLR